MAHSSKEVFLTINKSMNLSFTYSLFKFKAQLLLFNYTKR
ncbi:hypothetical protein THALO_420152 [Tenacibaculum halocynthiae]